MNLFGDAAALVCTKAAKEANSPSFPLSFMRTGEQGVINRISGKDEVRKYLSGLGFIPGTEVRIVNVVNGNVIVDVKGSRVAIDASMAGKIQCCPVS